MFAFIAGRSNCEWSSCEEGCTKTIYTCWQIEVAYERTMMVTVQQQPGINSGLSDTDSSMVDSSSPSGSRVGRGRLFPNVKVQ